MRPPVITSARSLGPSPRARQAARGQHAEVLDGRSGNEGGERRWGERGSNWLEPPSCPDERPYASPVPHRVRVRCKSVRVPYSLPVVPRSSLIAEIGCPLLTDTQEPLIPVTKTEPLMLTPIPTSLKPICAIVLGHRDPLLVERPLQDLLDIFNFYTKSRTFDPLISSIAVLRTSRLSCSLSRTHASTS